MIRDLTEGIEGSRIRAGVIGEIGTSFPLHPDERKSLVAAALAFRQTAANWVQCMRTRQKTAAPATVGHHSSVICHLVSICRELARKLQWDPVKEEFVGDDEANRLRSRPRRKGYELPVIEGA